MFNQIKICRCCGTKAHLRKRVCPQCKVPAIWDRATPEQQAAHDEEIRRRVEFAERMLREIQGCPA